MKIKNYKTNEIIDVNSYKDVVMKLDQKFCEIFFLIFYHNCIVRNNTLSSGLVNQCRKEFRNYFNHNIVIKHEDLLDGRKSVLNIVEKYCLKDYENTLLCITVGLYESQDFNNGLDRETYKKRRKRERQFVNDFFNNEELEDHGYCIDEKQHNCILDDECEVF